VRIRSALVVRTRFPMVKEENFFARPSRWTGGQQLTSSSACTFCANLDFLSRQVQSVRSGTLCLMLDIGFSVLLIVYSIVNFRANRSTVTN